MEEIQQRWHFLGKELAVVPDAVAAQRCFVFVHPFTKEGKGGLLSFTYADAFLANTLDEAAAVVVPRVPIIHAFNQGFRHRDGQIWTRGEDVQFTVCHHGCNLDDGLS